MGNRKLWAITTLFNPGGYSSRTTTFREFRRRLTVPLLVIEYSINATFTLEDGDADMVVRLSGDTVLWQKERLFNVALAHLPATADYVAWLDGDVIFADPLWPTKIMECLERYPIAQPYSYAIDLDQGEMPEQVDSASRHKVPSVAHLWNIGKWPVPEIQMLLGARNRPLGYGFAWATRREVLERHGFYDAMIIGSGPRAMFSAAIGRFEETIAPMRLLPEQIGHYMAWASPFHEEIKGRVGVVDGLVYHLWHGNIANRYYSERCHDLAQTGFDPRRHIQIATSGAWEWTEAAPSELRSLLTRYFEIRQEDTA